MQATFYPGTLSGYRFFPPAFPDTPESENCWYSSASGEVCQYCGVGRKGRISEEYFVGLWLAAEVSLGIIFLITETFLISSAS